MLGVISVSARSSILHSSLTERFLLERRWLPAGASNSQVHKQQLLRRKFCTISQSSEAMIWLASCQHQRILLIVGVDWNNFLHEDAPGAPPPNFLLFHHFANFVSFKRTGRLGHWFYCYLHILCREIGLWKHLFSWHERYFLIGAPGASTNRVNRIPTLASVLMLGMGYSMFQCLQFVNKSDRVVRGPFPVHFSMRARLMCFKNSFNYSVLCQR
jgi:hypothetical protein